MNSTRNIALFINPAGHGSDEYLVELRDAETSIAQVQVRIDREALLLHEHHYSARDYGMELYDALFTGKIGREYQRLVGRAGAATTIRIQLVISQYAAQLHALPWERLFHVFGDGDAPVACSAQTPFSRFLITGAGDQAPVQAAPLKLLIAIANPENLPPGLAPIDVAAETQALADLADALPGRLMGTLLPGRTGLPTPLRQRLLQRGWTIAEGVASWTGILRHLPGQHALHILAHGQFKANDRTCYLLLEREPAEDVAGAGFERVSDQAIVDGLSGVHPLPQLVFLAACESSKRPEQDSNPFVGLAPKLVEKGVPAVVAMQDLVPMGLARDLTADFYRRLIAHGQVDLALNEARALLFKREAFEWAIPVLFLRLRDGLIFSTEPNEPRQPFEPEMAFVPGGPFLMGSRPADGCPDAETPQHLLDLAGYFIGKYPVTNREYAVFLGHDQTRDLPLKAGWFNRKPPADRVDHPVTGVSWHDAFAYCTWLSRETGRRYRLPSEAEWEKAARGCDGRHYPWGEDWDERCVNVGTQGSTAVAAHPLGASPYGCLDMLGNVEEWTRTLWGTQWTPPDFGYPVDERDGRDMATAQSLPVLTKVVHRGGSYHSPVAEVYCARRGCADPASRILWRGFRVVLEA